MQNVQVLLHPGGVRRLATGRQRRGEHLERLEDLDLCLLGDPGALEQDRQGADVVSAEHDVDPGRLAGDGVAVLLRQAAAHGDLHARMTRLHRRQVTQVAVQPVVGVLADRAGVEDDHVGLLTSGGREVARVLQQPGQPLGVVHVHLTPVGDDLVRARRRRSSAPRRSRSSRSERLETSGVGGRGSHDRTRVRRHRRPSAICRDATSCGISAGQRVRSVTQSRMTPSMTTVPSSRTPRTRTDRSGSSEVHWSGSVSAVQVMSEVALAV
jgi:hypothetical protein